MLLWTTRCASVIALTSCVLFGQAAHSSQAFEVASVKSHQGPMYRIGVTTSGKRLNADAANLLVLIMFAYNLKNYQVCGTAPLFKDDNTRYDIVARADGDGAPSRDEFRKMLQRLLADRFRLKVHRELREMPVYALVVGKNGPKFKESAPGVSAMQHFGIQGCNTLLTMRKVNMQDVADAVTDSFLDRPVIDRTGLTGTYNIDMIYTPETRANRQEPDPNDISIFTALQNQLGLKLEAQKAMVEILTVDYAEKPSAN